MIAKVPPRPAQSANTNLDQPRSGNALPPQDIERPSTRVGNDHDTLRPQTGRRPKREKSPPLPMPSPQRSQARPPGEIELASIQRAAPQRGADEVLRPRQATQDALHVDDAAAINMSRLPSNMADLQRDLGAADTRAIDTAMVATLVNEVRHYGRRGLSGDNKVKAKSNDDLIAGISDHHLAGWNAAQGLTPEDVQVMNRAAFRSGLFQPTGSDPSNVLSYIVAPMMGAATGAYWVSPTINFLGAAAAPLINSWFQSRVVARCEMYRDVYGPGIVLAKNDVNDELTLQHAADAIVKKTEELNAATEAFGRAYGANQAAQQRGDADPTMRLQLRDLAKDVLAKSESLCDAQRNAVSTKGSHTRHSVGNANQVLPRTLRPVLAAAPSLGTGYSAEEAATNGKRVETYGSWANAGLQTAAAVLLMFGHHYAAGRDERNKQVYNNKLNLLYADILTPAGKTLFARGEPVAAEHVNPDKVRKLVRSPAQAVVSRVMEALEERKKAINKQIGQLPLALENALADESFNLDTLGSLAQDYAAEQPAQRREIPFGDEDLSEHDHAPAVVDQSAQDLHQNMLLLNELRLRSSAISRDIAQLKEGNLTSLPADSEARALIESSLSTFRSQLLVEVSRKKSSTKGEYSGQVIQRYGQALHMGVLGSGTASSLRGAASMISEGTKNASNAQIFIVTGVSGLMAWVGAACQSVAISEKFNRRANIDDVSAFDQFQRSMFAMPREYFGTRAVNAANNDAHQAHQVQVGDGADQDAVRHALAVLDDISDAVEVIEHQHSAVTEERTIA